VALPLVAPALVSAGIISFAFTWNEFHNAFILTYSRATPMTVVIAGTSDTTGIQFWYVSTRMLMAILPPALLTLTVQRYIVRGLTFGAVKGCKAKAKTLSGKGDDRGFVFFKAPARSRRRRLAACP